MKVLIACEESQTVCKAFRDSGHEAYSADIKDCSGGHPEWHIKGDVLPLLDGRCTFFTVDGSMHVVYSSWDLIIAHPPCPQLTRANNRSFSLRCTPADKVVEHWEQRALAAVFFMRFVAADCPRVCIENPAGFMTRAYRAPDQYIDPYQFVTSMDDSDYVKKHTGLWLKGLTPLKPLNSFPAPDTRLMYGFNPSGKAKSWTEIVRGSDRATVRSKTFESIARAMAEQWGK